MICIDCINEDEKLHVSHENVSQAWAAQLKWCAKTFAHTEQGVQLVAERSTEQRQRHETAADPLQRATWPAMVLSQHYQRVGRLRILGDEAALVHHIRNIPIELYDVSNFRPRHTPPRGRSPPMLG